VHENFWPVPLRYSESVTARCGRSPTEWPLNCWVYAVSSSSSAIFESVGFGFCTSNPSDSDLPHS